MARKTKEASKKVVDLTDKDHMIDIKKDTKGKINLNIKVKENSVSDALDVMESIVVHVREKFAREL